MSLSEDIETMEHHRANGTLREWFLGTAPMLDTDGRLITPQPKDGNDK